MLAALLAIGLALGLLWLGAAVGLRLQRVIGLEGDASRLESLVFAIGLGLGAIAYATLACAGLGVLGPGSLVASLALLTALARRELAQVAGAAPRLARAYLAARRELRKEAPPLRLAPPLAELTLLLLALQALAPPTGYDALIYHLEGARRLLALGRLAALPDLPQANMPFTVQLLYLIGLAFGSDEFGALLHLVFAALAAPLAFCFGQRFFGQRVGWLAALIVLSAPALAIYAPVAQVDYGWAYFDALAVYAIALWARSGRASWLAIAGLAAGLSMGSKYYGAITAGALGLAILTLSWSRARPRVASALANTVRFGVPAALVAAPWYLKNWAWFGAPFWPFLAPAARLDNGLYFAAQQGGGRGWLDLLLLPVKLFQGDFASSLAIPPLLFAAVPFVVFARRQPLILALLGLSGLHLAVWSQGVQTLRYLSPTFPLLALVAACALDRAWTVARSAALRTALAGLVVASMLPAVFTAGLTLAQQRSLPQLVGLESREAYLSRSLPDYPALRFLNERPAEVGRVLVIGDPHPYYLNRPAFLDQNLDLLATLGTAPTPTAARAQLRLGGISHVLVTRNLLDWLAHFDPEHRVATWRAGFDRVAPAILEVEFESATSTVYRVLPGPCGETAAAAPSPLLPPGYLRPEQVASAEGAVAAACATPPGRDDDAAL